MDLRFNAKNTTLSDRFKEYATTRASKVATLSPRAQTFEVKVSSESGSARSDARVELTVSGLGPVIRAEASAGDKFSALDLAYARLLERLRRAKERAQDRRQGKRARVRLSEAVDSGFAEVAVTPVRIEPAPVEEPPEQAQDVDEVEEYSPVVIRQKHFDEKPMTLDDALYRMELVGHDFYLFVDEVTGQPSVVYRRKGWNYGVISLGPQPK
ncbi:MAG: ribosome-associated translation inhibitor RaiA [Microbacteriaceae bacterium]|jgi:ribosomal subunit interface protein|nr:ribosome-associated translation inhibitor RaiA [Microbacteriaceae bacterium]MCI1206969.1 ribosome-associated translation inhibitor RaiA [Microbacteriaceae bacterium]